MTSEQVVEKIIIRINISSNKNIRYKLKKSLPIHKLFDAISSKLLTTPDTFDLVFKGIKLQPDDTVALTGLEDNDILQVVKKERESEMDQPHDRSPTPDANDIADTTNAKQHVLSVEQLKLAENQPKIELVRLKMPPIDTDILTPSDTNTEASDVISNSTVIVTTNTESLKRRINGGNAAVKKSKIPKMIPLGRSSNLGETSSDETITLSEVQRIEIKLLKKALDEKEKVINDFKAELEQHKTEKAEMIDRHRQAINNIENGHEIEVKTLMEQHRQSLEKAAADNSTATNKLKSDFRELMKNFEQSSTKFNKEKCDLLKQNETKDQTILALNKLIDEQKLKMAQSNSIEQTNHSIEIALKKDRDRSTAKWNQEKRQILKENDFNVQKIVSLEKMITEQKQKMAASSEMYSENITRLIVQCDLRRFDELEVLQKKIEAQKTAHAQEIETLNERLRLAEDQTEIEQLKIKNEHLVEKWTKKLEEALQTEEDVRADIIRKIKDAHNEAMEVVINDFRGKETALKSLQSAHDLLKENHIKKITKLKAQNNVKVDEQTEEIRKLKETIEGLVSLGSGETQAASKQSHELQRIDELTKELNKRNDQLAELEKSAAMKQRQLDEQSNELSQLKSKLKDNSNSHTVEMASLKDAHEQELKNMIVAHKNEMDELKTLHGESMHRLQCDHDENMKQLNEAEERHATDIKLLTIAYEKKMATCKDEYDKLSEMSRINLELHETAHQHEIAKLKEKHEQAIQDRSVHSMSPNSSSSENVAGNQADSTPKPDAPRLQKRVCCSCGEHPRFVCTYAYCSQACNIAYCFKKASQQPENPKPLLELAEKEE